MGYYSEGCFAIKKAEHAKQLLLLDGLPSLLGDMEEEVFDDYIRYTYEDFKMYDSYPDVAEFTNFMESLPDDQYAYIRVGEEAPDIEEIGETYDFGMYAKTIIEYD